MSCCTPSLKPAPVPCAHILLLNVAQSSGARLGCLACTASLNAHVMSSRRSNQAAEQNAAIRVMPGFLGSCSLLVSC